MTLTTIQRKIIKEICSIEFESLEDILQKPVLGALDDDFSIEEILAMHGCTRRDFDEDLINTYHQFQILHDEPDNLINLGHFEMIIFIQILHLLENRWKDIYPNALINLWNKIFIWEASNEIQNKN